VGNGDRGADADLHCIGLSPIVIINHASGRSLRRRPHPRSHPWPGLRAHFQSNSQIKANPKQDPSIGSLPDPVPVSVLDSRPAASFLLRLLCLLPPFFCFYNSGVAPSSPCDLFLSTGYLSFVFSSVPTLIPISLPTDRYKAATSTTRNNNPLVDLLPASININPQTSSRLPIIYFVEYGSKSLVELPPKLFPSPPIQTFPITLPSLCRLKRPPMAPAR